MIKIGITERGDAGLDTTWFANLHNVDMAILITKNVNATNFKRKIIEANNLGKKIILHATCTGMGGTALEPNVPPYKEQINGIKEIISKGFPVEHVVLRVDPIFPREDYVDLAKEVIDYALTQIPDLKRIRISIMDLHYKHLQKRFIDAGLADMLPHNFKSESYIEPALLQKIIQTFTPYKEKGLELETCAEPLLAKTDLFEHNGCASNKDIRLLGLPEETTSQIGRQRPGACTCLPKTELLTTRTQCPHKCLYCFWR